MNRLLLKWHMAANKDDAQTLAKVLNIHVNTLYNKMNENCVDKFTQDEIYIIYNRYGLTSDELVKIFFS